MKWISTISKNRLRLIFAAFILFGVIVFIRLFYVQVIQHDKLTELAKTNWDREIPFTSERGEITDRNGEVIVTNELAPTLYFMPTQNDNIEEAANQIADVLNLDAKRLFEKMNSKSYLVKLAPEAKNISYEQAVKIQELKIDGLYSGVDYDRSYPYGNLLSRLVGFTGYDSQGLAGIEYQYDKLLTSKDAAIKLFTDAKGKALPHVNDEWREGKQGATVGLTIDLEVQKVIERELSQAMTKYNAEQALAIAMNPKTGEILALSSYPTYDPSKFEEVESSIYNRNLPVWMTYEPGSTFKIITLSAAVEENVVDLEKDTYFDKGYTMVEGVRLRCWKRDGHGEETFLQVVENSCNPGFIELGQRVGADKLMKYIKNFGFGKTTGSNIAGEASGILFSEEAFGPVEHATTSFGQGISVTPIQQVQAVAAAVNGGKLFTPYVVSKVYNPESGEVVIENKPNLKRNVVSEETSKIVRDALESVVANGSGRAAYRDGLRIGGKTGTAQKVENGRYKDGDYIVSFIGFAPANDPEVVVYVAVDSPKGELVFGSTIVAPIVGQIIEDIAPILGIEKDREGQLEKQYRWGDKITERVPDLVGVPVNEIMELEYPYQIEVHGEGETVKAQLPEPESVLELDGTLHLYLEK
ncbi:cell division protein FtsI/penicillin-binding protein 2 [Solibacillus silvestris StLB046]|uniref:Cell division protein FtsI/penicillin-binding protein 2 n=1 Tax=Solibacillus silvestris (strain StLB046) TaxID=1002809 RepID=F2F602_SOLSS|nr:penicillin-binding transpeptidase domain-containing protein [Solibacillus silvestris]OBW56015.1 stage V sporulation protein D [Solibacillus silvestris]BAK17085.1 cell division protein FtsI/penicillin-binding protein 2 [Solibacillus silvestris StLB046]